MANAKGTKKRVEVGGVKYTVDIARLNSWTAAKMLAAINNASDTGESGSYAIQFADYVLGDEMAKICDACGGADAPAEDVIKLAYEVIGAASKN